MSLYARDISTLNVAPTGELERIARLLDVPLSGLSTIELSPGSRELYHAALEYAAMHPDLTPAASVAHPRALWSSPRELWQVDDNDSDDEDENSGRRDWMRGMFFGRPKVSGAGVIHKGNLRIPTPRYHFGIGTTAVAWPPPPHLEASVLANLSSYTPDITRSSPLTAKNGMNVDNCGSGAAPSGVDDHDADANEERTVVYYVHFARGDPVSLERASEPGPAIDRVLLLVGGDGENALRMFMSHVLKWHKTKEYRPGRPGRYALYRYATSGGSGVWAFQGLKRARPLSSVVLPCGQLDAIMDDIRSFLKRDTKAWYISHGLPHRRSYLFYGPPGVGKTSTIRAIASEFKLNCSFLTIANRHFSNQDLCDALSKLPVCPLLVIEDVDALFNEDRKNEDGGHNLTFSGLLNALDGLASADGVVTVLTTNHVERLDMALIRGGRVDRRFEFCRPTEAQIKDLFLSFYPSANTELANRFAAIVLSRPEGEEARSIATLQQHFINQRLATPEACVDGLSGFYESHFPSGFGGKSNSLYV